MTVHPIRPLHRGSYRSDNIKSVRPISDEHLIFHIPSRDEEMISALFERGLAMPSARAATPSGLSRFQRLRASIASLSRRFA